MTTVERVWLGGCATLIALAAWVRHCNNRAIANHAGPEED